MWWTIAAASIVWGVGFAVTFMGIQSDGNWFQRYVLGPVILFFIWPYVAWYMNTDH